jgi:hypothetical protein
MVSSLVSLIFTAFLLLKYRSVRAAFIAGVVGAPESSGCEAEQRKLAGDHCNTGDEVDIEFACLLARPDG